LAAKSAVVVISIGGGAVGVVGVVVVVVVVVVGVLVVVVPDGVLLVVDGVDVVMVGVVSVVGVGLFFAQPARPTRSATSRTGMRRILRRAPPEWG
jgi:hypothetical protein